LSFQSTYKRVGNTLVQTEVWNGKTVTYERTIQGDDLSVVSDFFLSARIRLDLLLVVVVVVSDGSIAPFLPLQTVTCGALVAKRKYKRV